MRNSDNGKSEVDRFLDELEHPLKAAVQAIRELILSADKSISEHIKWNAPSFAYGGDDRITFNLHRKDHLLLIFHRGAKQKPLNRPGRLIADPNIMLKWLADDRASLQIVSEKNLADISPHLKSLIREWLKAAAAIDRMA